MKLLVFISAGVFLPRLGAATQQKARRFPASIPYGDVKRRLTAPVLSFDVGAVFQQELTGEGVIVGGGAVKRGRTAIVLGGG